MPPGVKLARLAVLYKACILGSAPDRRERLCGQGEDTGSWRRQFRLDLVPGGTGRASKDHQRGGVRAGEGENRRLSRVF